MRFDCPASGRGHLRRELGPGCRRSDPRNGRDRFRDSVRCCLLKGGVRRNSVLR